MQFKNWRTKSLGLYESQYYVLSFDFKYRQSMDNLHIEVWPTSFQVFQLTGSSIASVKREIEAYLKTDNFETPHFKSSGTSSISTSGYSSNLTTQEHLIYSLKEDETLSFEYFCNLTSANSGSSAILNTILQGASPTEWHSFDLLEVLEIEQPEDPKPEIIETVKRQLGYVWITEEEEKTITETIYEGLDFLQGYDKTLTIDNIQQDYKVRSLLVNYCRYSVSNALDDYPKNYKVELIKLSNRSRKNKHATTEQKDD